MKPEIARAIGNIRNKPPGTMTNAAEGLIRSDPKLLEALEEAEKKLEAVWGGKSPVLVGGEVMFMIRTKKGYVIGPDDGWKPVAERARALAYLLRQAVAQPSLFE